MEIYFPTMLDKCKQKHCEREKKANPKQNKIQKLLSRALNKQVEEQIDLEDIKIAQQNEPLDLKVKEALIA